jgi:predicted dehydrogenase
MRVLVCGLGGIGQRHARNLRELLGKDLELDAWRVRGLSRTVSDRLEIEAGVDVEAKYGISRVDSLAEGLARKPDAVLVCNPSSHHVETAMAAAIKGCHVFIEKPLAHDAKGVGQLIDVARKAGVVGMVGYQLRFHPCIRKLGEWLAAGSIGPVLAVRAVVGEYLPWFHRYEDYREMYAARRELGGGVVLSQIHEFDYLQHLFGMPTRLAAVGGHLSSLELNVEDVASVLMDVGRDGRHVPMHLQQDFVQRPPNRGCEVTGDSGRITLDFTVPSLTRWDTNGEIAERFTPEGFVRNQLFLDEMKHFLDCIAGRVKPESSIADGARSLALALATHEALETRQTIDVAAFSAKAGLPL